MSCSSDVLKLGEISKLLDMSDTELQKRGIDRYTLRNSFHSACRGWCKNLKTNTANNILFSEFKEFVLEELLRETQLTTFLDNLSAYRYRVQSNSTNIFLDIIRQLSIVISNKKAYTKDEGFKKTIHNKILSMIEALVEETDTTENDMNIGDVLFNSDDNEMFDESFIEDIMRRREEQRTPQ